MKAWSDLKEEEKKKKEQKLRKRKSCNDCLEIIEDIGMKKSRDVFDKCGFHEQAERDECKFISEEAKKTDEGEEFLMNNREGIQANERKDLKAENQDIKEKMVFMEKQQQKILQLLTKIHYVVLAGQSLKKETTQQANISSPQKPSLLIQEAFNQLEPEERERVEIEAIHAKFNQSFKIEGADQDCGK